MCRTKGSRSSFFGRCASTTMGVALAFAVLLLAAPAGAHQSPAGCNTNKVALNTGVDQSTIVNGTIVHYTVEVLNPGSGSGVACDAGHIAGAPTGTNTGVDVTFFCPGANGLPNLAAPVVLATSKTMLADGSGDQSYTFDGAGGTTAVPGLACLINVNAGVTNAEARATADGSLHAGTLDSALGRVNNLPVAIVQCLTTADCTGVPAPECQAIVCSQATLTCVAVPAPALNSTACSGTADTPGDCLLPGCQNGVCEAAHVGNNVADSTSCSSTADIPGDCRLPGCEGGVCVATHLPDSSCTTPIPTLSGWAQFGMALFLMSVAVWYLRRRRA